MKETSLVTLSPELIGRIEKTEADRFVFDFLKNHNFELLIDSWGILMVLYFNFYTLYFRKEISPCLTDSFSFELEKIVSAFHISCRPALCPRTLNRFKIRWFMILCPSTGTSRHSPSLKSILAEWYLMAGRPHVIPQISTGFFLKNIISCCFNIDSERHLFFVQKTIEPSYRLDKISFRTALPTAICCLHSQVIFYTFEEVFRLLQNLAWGTKTHREIVASRAASRPENLVPLALKPAFLIKLV